MDKKYLKQASSGLWLYRRKTPVQLRDKYDSDYIQYTLHTHSYNEPIIKRNKKNADIDMELHYAKQGNAEKAKFYYDYTPWRRERLERENEPHSIEIADVMAIVTNPDDKKNPTVHAGWRAAMTGKIPDKFQPTTKELADEWTLWAEDKKDSKYISAMKTYVSALTFLNGRCSLNSLCVNNWRFRLLDLLTSIDNSVSH